MPPDPGQILTTQSGLTVYGPLGFICLFFMGVSVYLLAQNSRRRTEEREDNKELVAAIKEQAHAIFSQSHRIAGLERAILMELDMREGLSLSAKTACRKRVAYLDAYLDRNDTRQ